MNLTDLCEKRLLPVVMAFGCGVLAMKFAAEHREAEALDLAARAVAVAEAYRDACSLWPPAELPEKDLARLAEARP